MIIKIHSYLSYNFDIAPNQNNCWYNKLDCKVGPCKVDFEVHWLTKKGPLYNLCNIGVRFSIPFFEPRKL